MPGLFWVAMPFRRSPPKAGSLMLQSGAHVGNRDFEEAKRCAKASNGGLLKSSIGHIIFLKILSMKMMILLYPLVITFENEPFETLFLLNIVIFNMYI